MRTKSTFFGIAAAATFLGSFASAQNLGQVLICDPINEQVYRLSDENGDGDYLDADETTLLLDFGLAGFFNPDTAEMRSEAGVPVVYAVVDFPEGIVRGADVDGNGTIGTGELTVFFDALIPFGSMNPEGLTLTSDGAVWFSSNFESFEGLWRLEDLNGDDDANDPGEFVRLIDGSFPLTVETDSGPVAINADDIWRIARDGNGVVGYNGFSSASLSDEDSIFRFEDKNGDGDVADAGEARLFLNYTGKNPSLPVNPDFGTVLPTLQIPNLDNPATPYYARLNHVETRDNAGTTEYFFGTDSSSTSIFSTSVTGDLIHGLVFKGIVNNSDGDVNDAGEVTVYYDGSFDGPLGAVDALDKIVGMGEDDGWLYLADAIGGRVIRVKDLNGDGDALDQNVDLGGGVFVNEIEPDLWTFGAWGMAPPITDPLGPFFEDIEAGPNGLFPPGSSNFTTFGVPCSQFAPGPPLIAGSGKAALGTSGFTCSVSGTGPSLPATLAFGLSNTDLLGIPLPLDLTPFSFSGCTLYQNLTGQVPAATDALGTAAIAIPVPVDSALVALPIYLQWLIVDPFGGGIALSNAGTVILEQ